MEDSRNLSASEFSFLAVGLVLGIASGAALIEVLRARPPASREIRLTVSPNAIHSRLSSTLADPGAREVAGPAAGGPGDRRWRDELVATGEPAATGRRSQDPRRDGPAGAGDPHNGTPVRDRASTETAPATASPAGARAMVAVPMSLEPDPITTALRATAAASAVAAMRATSGRTAIAERPIASAGGNGPAPATAAVDRAVATDAPVDNAGAPSITGESGESRESGADGADGADGQSGATSSRAADGPCAEERRVADERCAVATRARSEAATAHDTFRSAQRTHDELVARSAAAAITGDPRAVRTAKEAAQHRFRESRGAARTRDDVEAGARTWLAEINRINRETREAALAAEQDRAAAAALSADLERLAVEADAARILAEAADEACVAAREVVATCDEARILAETAAAARPVPALTSDEDGADEGDGEDGADRIAAASAADGSEVERATPMASRSGEDAPILRILRGDRQAMQHAVGRLAGEDPESRRVWQTRLSGLAEALIARSIEAASFDFPTEHFFWGPFSQGQSRDIAAALSSLGFRFDGFGDWVDERQPSQRDLSMAVGYAGLDPMRVRHWPTEAETRDLLRDVRVAADEYVAGAAGGLTLGELVTLLGRRADTLTELWNEWGTVRPILLEAG
jgi:hypothetical protein